MQKKQRERKESGAEREEASDTRGFGSERRDELCLCCCGCGVAQMLHCRVETSALLSHWKTKEESRETNLVQGGMLNEVGKKVPVL